MVEARLSPAHEDGAWLSLVTPFSTRPLQAIVTAVDPHLGVEVGGTDTEWVARIVHNDAPAKDLSEVEVTKFSGGATFTFEPRHSLPLTVV